MTFSLGLPNCCRPLAAVAGSLAALALGACGGDAAPDADGRQATRSVEHAKGTSTVPARPRRLVALDEIAGLTALGYGVKPAVVFTSAGDAPSQAILRRAGVPLADAPVAGLPELEALARRRPDMLIGTGPAGGAGAQYDRLSRIAPTAVLAIEGSWARLIEQNAAIFGAEGRGRREIAAIRARLETARTGAGGRTLSLIGNSFSKTTFTMPPKSPVSTLIADAGFIRPAAQRRDSDSYSIELSEERLGEHDGDLVVVPSGAFYTADAVTRSPVFRRLRATTVQPVGETWFGVHPFAFYAIAEDLARLGSGSRDVLTPRQLPELWTRFEAVS